MTLLCVAIAWMVVKQKWDRGRANERSSPAPLRRSERGILRGAVKSLGPPRSLEGKRWRVVQSVSLGVAEWRQPVGAYS